MKVLIVDSSKQILERLQELLSDEKSISEILTIDSYTEASKLFNENKPDVVLMDCAFHGNGEMTLLKKIKETSIKTSVIVFVNQFDDHLMKECTSYGADFLFDKYSEFEKIPALINEIGVEKNNKANKDLKNEKIGIT